LEIVKVVVETTQ